MKTFVFYYDGGFYKGRVEYKAHSLEEAKKMYNNEKILPNENIVEIEIID